ncbi:hypothetical protein CAPTEDRAFT_207187 [Capitella teleta]|uniref:DUF4371 domain-containing protein n=1 Tax=Capitella teleta TaxID=283909 RepID=R7T7D0_CAPTE|nr:hypothetical protein CAPTEDRAFT_207187 [Capitella teleta]|eukprot:ELT89313.1 hypothetical protein CAPTEDRAFT_207187 [Capitella teleta]
MGEKRQMYREEQEREKRRMEQEREEEEVKRQRQFELEKLRLTMFPSSSRPSRGSRICLEYAIIFGVIMGGGYHNWKDVHQGLKFHANSSDEYFPSSPQEKNKTECYAALDVAIGATKRRVDQEGYKAYSCPQQFLLKAARGEDCLREINQLLEQYGDRRINPEGDFDKTRRQQRLNNLMVLHIHQTFTDYLNIDSVVEEFITTRGGRKLYFI